VQATGNPSPAQFDQPQGAAGVDTAPTHGVPELAGVAVTAVMHRWHRKTVLSIAAGTVVCLILT
jgi:branched chain amino acid efflux pump